MKNIGEVITKQRKAAGLTQAQLATQLNIPRTNLSTYEQEKAMPPLHVLKSFAEFFKMDFREFVYSAEELQQMQNSAANVLVISTDANNNENIVMVPEKAAAGYATGYSDPEFVQELPRFQLPFLKNGTFRAFEINGDSMLPIPSGSIIIGRYIESLAEVKREKTYIFVTASQGIVFKRVAAIGYNEILLKSDNPLYQSYTLPRSDIREIWKSRMWMSSEYLG